MGRFADLVEILRLPNGPRTFLRREYDRLTPLLFRLGRHYRRLILRRPRLCVIVGSLGKTTTRQAVAAALDCPDRHFSYSNYGASLAENLFRVRPWDRHAVLEVGIDGPDRMAPNARLLAPDLVVVTAIASDHNRSFPTLADTRAEKVKMVSGLPPTAVAILNGDDPNVRWMATQTRARVITIGAGADNDVRAVDIRETGEGLAFDVEIAGRRLQIESRLHGRHMIYPLLAGLVAAELEGIAIDGARARLASVVPVAGRMETISLPGDVRVVHDAQKASIESIYAALDAFAVLPARRRIVVMGKIEEPPGKSRLVYRALGTRLAAVATRLICIGTRDDHHALRGAAMRAGMQRDDIVFCGSRIDEVPTLLSAMLAPGDVVLVKGASAQRLERIVLALEGRRITCRAQFCNVKSATCGACPVLAAPPEIFANRYIRRALTF